MSDIKGPVEEPKPVERKAMPLRKSTETSDGVTHASSHWVLGELSLDYIGRKASLRFFGYKDVAAKTAGKTRIGEQFFQISGATFESYFGNTAQGSKTPESAATEYALTQSAFSGATQVDDSGNPAGPGEP